MAREKMNKKNTITLEGFVEAVELEDGDIGVVIYDGEEDYYVVMDKQGRQLLDHIEDEVEATGVVSEDDDYLTFKISYFRVLDPYDDWDGDGDDDYDYDDR